MQPAAPALAIAVAGCGWIDPTPESGTELGGANLDVYCSSIGAKAAFVDAATGTWRCAQGGDAAVAIDHDAACMVSYADPAAKARTLHPGDTSIVCVHP